MQLVKQKKVYNISTYNPVGKIAEKAVCRSVFGM